MKLEHFNGACGVCSCDSEYNAAVCFRALGSPLKAVYCACLLVCVHTVVERVWKSEDCLWELINLLLLPCGLWGRIQVVGLGGTENQGLTWETLETSLYQKAFLASLLGAGN